MRIGDFSNKNAMAVDTVRYYVNLKLINPRRKGRYFYFDDTNQEELDEIIRLKHMRFSLNQIKEIVYLKNLEKIQLKDRNQRLQGILEDQMALIDDEIHTLTKIKSALKSTLDEVMMVEDKHKTYGLPILFTPYLACPTCQTTLSFEDAIIKQNNLVQGRASCQCGFHLHLEEGILYPQIAKADILNPMSEVDAIDNFIEETPSSFMDFMFSSMNDLIRSYLRISAEEHIVLDMKSGVGILSAQVIEKSEAFKYLILVDEDPVKLKIAKASLDQLSSKGNIIYISCDIGAMPIRKKSIHVVLDCAASFIDGFRHGHNIYEDLLPYMHDHSWLLGLFMYFKTFSTKQRLPEAFRKNFDGTTVFEKIEEAGFKVEDQSKKIKLTEGNNINDFFRDGDEVMAWIRTFKR